MLDSLFYVSDKTNYPLKHDHFNDCINASGLIKLMTILTSGQYAMSNLILAKFRYKYGCLPGWYNKCNKMIDTCSHAAAVESPSYTAKQVSYTGLNVGNHYLLLGCNIHIEKAGTSRKWKDNVYQPPLHALGAGSGRGRYGWLFMCPVYNHSWWNAYWYFNCVVSS